MANKVEVVNLKVPNNKDRAVKLNNGALVLILNKSTGQYVGKYLVTSFRNSNKESYKKYTTSYCTLVNFDDGQIKFEEPCSRTTTEGRVLAHIYASQSSYRNTDTINTICNQYEAHIYNVSDYGVRIILGEEMK